MAAIDIARIEVSAFYSAIARTTALTPTRKNRHGYQYLVMEEAGDPNLARKRVAVDDALREIATHGFALPSDTCFWLVNTYEAQNRAFHFNPQGKAVCWITLGRSCITGGTGAGISAPLQNTPGFSAETKITIHELGHNIHAHAVGLDGFFGDGWKGKCTCADEVSAYAGNNKKEFVAEVFLGRIVGRTYSAQCMNEYTGLSGPAV